MEKESLFEQFRKSFADAVTDIREKVVEEPMYGRTLSSPNASPQWPEPKGTPAFGSMEQSREIATEPDRNIDR